ncbi:MAG: 3-phosphoshikimate 1-carboxyvinyltransferase [Pirellulales bacterium]|nr:3-phosphoshikimate 1-carboxyvinyltransferase [Pirellulales bacterium]
MPDSIAIQPSGPLQATVCPPGSKSITNRALVCAALADGDSTLHGALDSDDTRAMIDALGKLGIEVHHDTIDRTVRVRGCDGHPPVSQADLYVAGSGTTMRFLTAAVCLGDGTYRLDGAPRMRQRPLGDLLDALRQMGADAASELDNGCPPVIVRAAGLKGGRIVVSGEISSQFLSGLLLAAPYARQAVELIPQGRLVSQPYIEMTLAVMKDFGVETRRLFDGGFAVPAGRRYRGRQYQVEPDASAASYFFAAAAIAGGQVTVEGLSKNSIQGDIAFCDCLQKMGCKIDYRQRAISVTGGKLQGIEIDMNAISDTVQTLAAVALFAEGPTTIAGVAHIRHKETDRLGALAAELRKFGAEVEEFDDGLKIAPGELRAARIDTYDDHRMAMSMALVGLRVPGVVILDPACTAKTYPLFFRDLEKACNR